MWLILWCNRDRDRFCCIIEGSGICSGTSTATLCPIGLDLLVSCLPMIWDRRIAWVGVLGVGGTSTVIANFLRSRRINRKVYALDAFRSGFDIDELEEERQLGLAQVTSNAFNNRVWFKDTLLHVDSRFYLSLIDCGDPKKSILYSAETIWPKHSVDGIYCSMTTHDFKGAKSAVE